MNSEGFRETFPRNDREGPTKAKMAGKKEAKRKAGPSALLKCQIFLPPTEVQKRSRRFGENKEQLQEGRAKRSPESAATAATGASSKGSGRRKHYVRRSAACVLAHGVGMPHDRVHGALSCSSGVQLLSVSLSEGENEEGEKPEALRGLSHLRALYASQELSLQKRGRGSLSCEEMRERPPPPAAV